MRRLARATLTWVLFFAAPAGAVEYVNDPLSALGALLVLGAKRRRGR